MLKKYFIPSLLLVVVIAASIFITVNRNSNAAQTQASGESSASAVNLNKTLSSAGEIIKTHPVWLAEAIDALDNLREKNADIIVVIDGVQLSDAEFKLHKGLAQAEGQQAADDNTVFNVLAEEKMLLGYALKNNLLPDKDEIDASIEAEKENYNQDSEFKEMIDTFCSTADLTLDQYWNAYEYYNVYRVVAISKVYDFILENAEKSEVDTPAEQQKYYNQFKMKLKTRAKVEIEKSYKNMNLHFDATKLYL